MDQKTPDIITPSEAPVADGRHRLSGSSFATGRSG